MANQLPPLSIIPSPVWQDNRLSKTDFRVLGALCARRNKRSRLCCPSIQTIVDDLGIGRSHVKKARKRLRDFGYISWDRTSKGRGSSCRYVIPLLDKVKAKTRGASSARKGAEPAPHKGGETSPPNIEGNIEVKTFSKEHTASPIGDGAAFRQEVAIIDRKIREHSVRPEDLHDLNELIELAQSDGDIEKIGYVERVYDDALSKLENAGEANELILIEGGLER